MSNEKSTNDKKFLIVTLIVASIILILFSGIMATLSQKTDTLVKAVSEVVEERDLSKIKLYSCESRAESFKNQLEEQKMLNTDLNRIVNECMETADTCENQK